MASTSAGNKRQRITDGDSASDISMETDWESYVKDPAGIGGLDLVDCCALQVHCIKKIKEFSKKNSEKHVEALSFIVANLNNQNTTREMINELKTELSSQRRQQQQSKPTYSSILSRGVTQSFQAPKQQEDTVIIKPKEGTSPAVLETKVKSMIRASTANHKVNYVKATRNAVIIKVPKNSNKASQLIEEINNNTETKIAGNAYSAKPKDPTIVLWGVAHDTPIESIPEQICKKNEALTGLQKDFQYMFKVRGGQRAGEMNIALRVSPKVFSIMTDPMGLAFRVHLETQVCKVKPRIFIKQCQKCYQYQHKTADCPNKMACRDCGEERTPDHHCNGPKCCTNCKKSDRHRVSVDHSPNTTLCPIYDSLVRREDEQTDYGPKHDTISSPQ